MEQSRRPTSTREARSHLLVTQDTLLWVPHLELVKEEAGLEYNPIVQVIHKLLIIIKLIII